MDLMARRTNEPEKNQKKLYREAQESFQIMGICCKPYLFKHLVQFQKDQSQ